MPLTASISLKSFLYEDLNSLKEMIISCNEFFNLPDDIRWITGIQEKLDSLMREPTTKFIEHAMFETLLRLLDDIKKVQGRHGRITVTFNMPKQVTQATEEAEKEILEPKKEIAEKIDIVLATISSLADYKMYVHYDASDEAGQLLRKIKEKTKIPAIPFPKLTELPDHAHEYVIGPEPQKIIAERTKKIKCEFILSCPNIALFKVLKGCSPISLTHIDPNVKGKTLLITDNRTLTREELRRFLEQVFTSATFFRKFTLPKIIKIRRERPTPH